MHNYKLIVQYDGTNYAGWQTQQNAITVQQTIEEAINKITGNEVNVIGSGRTDTGVHALGQCANFRIDAELDLYKFKYSLNSILPKDISVIDIKETDVSFHARFDAVKRSYLYFILTYKSPFYSRFSYSFFQPLNIQRLNELSAVFLGTHNFTSFSRKNSETENKICCVHNAFWRQTKGMIIFYIEADRYLHGMVRTITGTVLRAYKLNQSKEDILKIFDDMDRESAGEAVPAKGLFLYKVKYKK